MNSSQFVLKTDSKHIYLESDETLLEAFERVGLNCEYQCRQGYCGHCRMRLSSGEISYRNEVLAYLREGEILICQAEAKTDVQVEKLL